MDFIAPYILFSTALVDISSISAIYLHNNLTENQQLSKYINERVKNIDVEQLNF